MTVLFAGGEMGAFIPSDSNTNESTSTGKFDTAFARCALAPSGSSSYGDSFEFAETADVWIHFENQSIGATSSATLTTCMTMLNGSGTEVFKLQTSTPTGSGSQTWQLQYWNGSAWTNLGSSFAVNNALQTVDIHLVANSASGSGSVYLSGTQRSTGTADLSSIAGVAQIRPYGKQTGIQVSNYFSQLIVASESTIGWRLKTVPATGAGSTSSWTGTFAEIDEIAYSDLDFINSATAAQVQLFSHSTTIPTGYKVKAAIVTARAKCGSGGPQNIQLALKSGATTYFSATQACDEGYLAHVGVWENDPATSAAFTTSAAAAIQFGVKSIT
jgi:hypothetical protein